MVNKTEGYFHFFFRRIQNENGAISTMKAFWDHYYRNILKMKCVIARSYLCVTKV